MSRNIRILVVDDNPSMTKTLADILEAKGFGVVCAFSGSEALEVLKNNHIDILLTDVKMPDMSGVEVFRQARADHPNMFTFLMTAYAADEIIQEGIREGIKTVLTKPLDIAFLVSLLDSAANIIERSNRKRGSA